MKTAVEYFEALRDKRHLQHEFFTPVRVAAVPVSERGAPPPPRPRAAPPSFESAKDLLGPQALGNEQYASDRRVAMDALLADFPTVAKWGTGSWHQYDLALSLYKFYAVTANPKYRDGARRHVEDLQANSPYFNAAEIEKKTVGDYSAPYAALPVYSNINAFGLATYVLETPDPHPTNSVRRIIKAHARYYWPMMRQGGNEGWWGPRSGAASPLHWILAVIAIGDGDEPMQTEVGLLPSYKAAAQEALGRILAAQGAYGAPPAAWAEMGKNFDDVYGAPHSGSVMNFMMALLTEILIVYERLLGDARILPALTSGYNFLQTQWQQEVICGHPAFPEQGIPAWGCFGKSYNYSDRGTPEAPAPPCPMPRLNGLFMALTGYLAAKTGDAKYQARLVDLWDGVHTDLARGPLTTKEFGENYRASGDGWGHVETAGGGGGTTPVTVKLNAPSTAVGQGMINVTVPLTAETTGNVKSVSFLMLSGPGVSGSSTMAKDVLSPWAMEWSLRKDWTPAGVYELGAAAEDTQGRLTSSPPVRVTVTQPGDVQPGTATGATDILVALLRVVPTAGKAVTSVQFFVNEIPHGTPDTSGPDYSRRWMRPEESKGPFVFTGVIAYTDGSTEKVKIEPTIP